LTPLLGKSFKKSEIIRWFKPMANGAVTSAPSHQNETASCILDAKCRNKNFLSSFTPFGRARKPYSLPDPSINRAPEVHARFSIEHLRLSLIFIV
jgi:hypothetical protein